MFIRANFKPKLKALGSAGRGRGVVRDWYVYPVLPFRLGTPFLIFRARKWEFKAEMDISSGYVTQYSSESLRFLEKKIDRLHLPPISRKFTVGTTLSTNLGVLSQGSSTIYIPCDISGWVSLQNRYFEN